MNIATAQLGIPAIVESIEREAARSIHGRRLLPRSGSRAPWWVARWRRVARARRHG